MDFELSIRQREDQAAFKAFVDARIGRCADRFDQEQRLPASVVGEIAAEGYLGATVAREYGGRGMDAMTVGLLQEEFGRASASVQSLLTVHGMVTHALGRWGRDEQRRRWLGALARGESIGAFCLSEPETGSDAAAVRTTARAAGDSYVLDGTKSWISFGQVATLYLVLAQLEGKPTAFLIERDSPGLTVTPIRNMLGFRAAMLAELRLESCRVGAESLLGRPGCGFSHVVAAALDLGRYCVACGCVGLGQACLDASLRHARSRRQFGELLTQHQLIQRMLSRMIAGVAAGRLLCRRAGWLREVGDPGAIRETMIAKYYASTMVNSAAADAVQIHGAIGCTGDHPVQRLFRDARIMEIIEGSSQILEIMIARGAGHGEAEP